MALPDLLSRLADWRARRAMRRAAPATGFAREPEPRLPGSFARGRRIAAGSFRLAGKTLDARDPFAAPPPSPDFAAALHGWGWLDELAACGEPEARAAARRWLGDWIARFGDGAGPGWTPELAGRRVLRWTEHALFLVADAERGLQVGYLTALGRHAAYLARRWPAAPPGLPRIEALAGWLHAALVLRGLDGQAGPAAAALAAEAEARIDPEGGIPERCPETLLWIAAHLLWSREALQAAEQPVPQGLDAALRRAARALRALRHADGGLARFHGGGAGPEGLADRVLAEAAPDDRMRPVRAMGFARLEGGRSTLILDAAPPPATARAQSGALAFELTSGRRPLVVGCGAGHEFGPDWAAAGRAAAGASTLALDGGSPAGPVAVTLHRTDERGQTALLATHDGWVPGHGLSHSRELRLSADGRALMGEDALAPLTPEARARFDRLLAATGGRGPDFALRFHLHPDVEAAPDTAQGARLALGSGELWLFRFDGRARLDLEPSVWLEPGRRAPRPCRQIVLRGQVAGAGARINWTLAKAQATPLAIRDIGQDADLSLPPDLFDRD